MCSHPILLQDSMKPQEYPGYNHRAMRSFTSPLLLQVKTFVCNGRRDLFMTMVVHMVNIFGVMASSAKYRTPVKRFSLDSSLLKEKKACCRNRWCSFFFFFSFRCLSERFKNYFCFGELYFLLGVLSKLVLCGRFSYMTWY